jgi:proteasome lid subunit RPN8/RPN11
MLGVNNGVDRIVEEIVELENEQNENRRRRFFVTPKQYLRAERAAAGRKLELLGFYHSHPDHPAVPSEFDKDHALPWFTYIVVSITNGKAEDMTAWLLLETREGFDNKEIMIEEEVDSKR